MKIKQICEKPDFWIREPITCREGVNILHRLPNGGTLS